MLEIEQKREIQMKTIKGITEKLAVFSLRETQEVDSNSFQDVFRTIISLSIGKSAEQALEMFEIGLKLKNNKESNLELEDAEFKLLKEKVEANPNQQPAFFHAQLLLKLKEAENDSIKKS